MPRIYRDQVEAGSLLVIPSGTAVTSTRAQGTLAFSDSVSDGETVTIGGAVYEFDTDGTTAEGNIAVDVSQGFTASDAVTALVAAIEANEDSVVTAVDGEGNTVVVTAVVYGTEGNSIAVDTDADNGEWTKATLTGGVDGTVAKKGTIMFDANYVYVAVDDCTETVSNWKKATLA
jgi:phage tail sheath gpL-like